ncbi:MAG: tRNA 2-thiouridine(34) synthase MnmA [Candidatus Falkowbacteria bacterium]|nr:tRNA 2-thiouridine(34) synthase MnmA [Candidatus Falkowbacteria bacterium]
MNKLVKATKKSNSKRVIVGLSGGVDSSVAAALLIKQGYEVIGVFMRNWSEDVGDFSCSWTEDLEDARRVAQLLGIRFYVWNFEKEYKQEVIGYFFKEYQAGRTPNPDVMCNREIKFKLFLEKALRFGADYVATGHYARIIEKNKHYELHRGKDPNKDQSYFLCTLGQDQLKHALFPIGDYLKPAIRKLAKQYGLLTFDKPDSQGICFIGEIDVKDLLKRNVKMKPGKVFDESGKLLGTHDGLPLYTIGQRGGLEIGGNGPYYVISKDEKKNSILVSNNPNDPLLWRKECLVNELTWTRPDINIGADSTYAKASVDKKLEVAIRYRHPAELAKVKIINKDKLSLDFIKAQRAITPGQLAVFYKGTELLGSGVIDKVL